MAGELISLWSARRLSFSGLASNTTAELAMSGLVDLLRYRDGVFLARVHGVDITGSGALDLVVHPSAPSREDPGRSFVDREVELARISLAGTASGALLREVLPAAFGACVQVFAVATQPVGVVETLEARISAAFLARM